MAAGSPGQIPRSNGPHAAPSFGPTQYMQWVCTNVLQSMSGLVFCPFDTLGHLVFCCRLEDALQDFTAAIETDPSSALSFNSRALLLERLGQPAAALADHDAAVALDARDAGYIKSRGLCARTLGQYEAAARDFTRCVEAHVWSAWPGKQASSCNTVLACSCSVLLQPPNPVQRYQPA